MVQEKAAGAQVWRTPERASSRAITESTDMWPGRLAAREAKKPATNTQRKAPAFSVACDSSAKSVPCPCRTLGYLRESAAIWKAAKIALARRAAIPMLRPLERDEQDRSMGGDGGQGADDVLARFPKERPPLTPR